MEGTTPTPQQAPVYTEEQVAAIRAQVVDEITGGKYGGDVAKAKDGFWNLTNYSSQLATAQQHLDARINPGALAASREPASNPWDAVKTDYYGDTNALREAVRAETLAAVAQAFEPIQQTVQARTAINRTLPEYAANEQQVIDWLETRPDIYALVYNTQQAGQAEAAMRLAYREYYAATNGKVSTPPKPEGIPGGSGTPPTMAPPAMGQPNMGELVQQAKMRNNPTQVFNALWPDFEPILPPHLKG